VSLKDSKSYCNIVYQLGASYVTWKWNDRGNVSSVMKQLFETEFVEDRQS